MRFESVPRWGPDTGARFGSMPRESLPSNVGYVRYTCVLIPSSDPRSVHEFRGAEGGVDGHVLSLGYACEGFIDLMTARAEFFFFLRMTRIHLDYRDTACARALSEKKKRNAISSYIMRTWRSPRRTLPTKKILSGDERSLHRFIRIVIVKCTYS